ncbi:hypothetical protein MUK42_32363 [Musa troglodytarum]|uniref:Uncharacterized protein n=1 Tax=Musa troglodytarum TaxID=320322 RepID=A0A9E7GDW0_9LILI|nr:hypothetical protein MUK42_32363 [Musa troglodytarum]
MSHCWSLHWKRASGHCASDPMTACRASVCLLRRSQAQHAVGIGFQEETLDDDLRCCPPQPSTVTSLLAASGSICPPVDRTASAHEGFLPPSIVRRVPFLM